MAQLTWHDVAAPDFRSAMDGYQLFGDNINRGVANLQAALGKFDQQATDRANTNYALKLASYSDPKALEAALAADPTLGQDAKRLTAATIGSGSDRVSNLLSQATAANNLDFTTGQRARTVAQQGATDAAASDANRYITLKNSTNPADQIQAAAILASSPTLSKLTNAELTDLVKSGQGQVMGNLDIAGKALSNEGQGLQNTQTGVQTAGMRQSQALQAAEGARQAAQFNWLSQDRDAQQSAQSAIARLSQSTLGGNASDVQAAVLDPNGPLKGMTDQAKFLTLQALGLNTGGLGPQPAGGSASGMIAAAANGGPSPVDASGNPTATKMYGGGQLPASVNTLGAAVDYGRNVMIPNTRGKVGAGPNAGTSAVGTYQITQGTMNNFAPKVFGANWRNVPLTEAAQSQIGSAIWNVVGGRVPQMIGQWPSLKRFSADQQDQIAKMPWDQAKTFIAQGESGATPASMMAPIQLQAQSNQASALLAARNAQNTYAGGLTPQEYSTGMQDVQSNPATVARNLIASNPGFKGANADDLSAYITSVMNQAQSAGGSITPALAGQIVARNLTSGGFSAPQHWWGGSRSGFDTDGVQRDISAVAKGTPFATSRTAEENTGVAQAVQGYTAQYSQAQAAYQQAVQAAQRNPALRSRLPAYKQAADAAYANLRTAQLLAGSSQFQPITRQ